MTAHTPPPDDCMSTITVLREKIYDHFHGKSNCQAYFFHASHADEYVAYYNSMYLLQDSTEALLYHRSAGFSNDPLAAYLEFWGVMQAAVIQQDAIKELHQIIVQSPLDAKVKNLVAWLSVRDLRNLCAGHPVKKARPASQPLSRTFMGRSFGNYENVTYEKWQQGGGISHPSVALGALLDSYFLEASGELALILLQMQTRWP